MGFDLQHGPISARHRHLLYCQRFNKLDLTSRRCKLYIGLIHEVFIGMRSTLQHGAMSARLRHRHTSNYSKAIIPRFTISTLNPNHSPIINCKMANFQQIVNLFLSFPDCAFIVSVQRLSSIYNSRKGMQ